MKRFILTEKYISINLHFKDLMDNGDKIWNNNIKRDFQLVTDDIIIIKEVIDKRPHANNMLGIVQVEFYAYTFLNHNDIIFNNANSQDLINKTEMSFYKKMRKKYPGREFFGPSWVSNIRWYKPDFCELFYIGCFSIDRQTSGEISKLKYDYLEKNNLFNELEEDLIDFTLDCAKEYNKILTKNYINYSLP